MCAKKITSTAVANKDNVSKGFPIVAIGASAGGIEAMRELLRSLPKDTGMAYVYIQHLDPTFDSKLTEVFSTYTEIKIQEARHRMKIEKDHLYVIPPNKNMAIVDGTLTLKPRESKPAVNMPIDEFFMSLAEKQQEKAIGIILSGANSDGAEGLLAIKEAGGVTIAQDDTARFDTMPRAAIATGAADLVMSPSQMASELERISSRADLYEMVMSPENNYFDPSMDEDLPGILQLIKKETTVDFSHYKINTTRRRIMRRMLLHKLDTLKEYTVLLKEQPHELRLLHQDLMINVTSFFRHAEALEFFKKQLLPQMLEAKTPNETFRVWVPACSTGEEAYSLAMVIDEVLVNRKVKIQVFGTDLSEQSIVKARLGIYSQAEVQNVSQDRLYRYFTKIDGAYRINKTIRDIVVFAPHNLFKDPPFSRLDLVSCCNVLIYLDNMLQRRIMATFHYALKHEKYLILGQSETVGTAGRLFSQVDKKFKIYTKIGDVNSNVVFDMNMRLPEVQPPGMPKALRQSSESQKQDNLEKNIDDVLLQKYTPPSVVVNHDMEIVLFRGSTGQYLEPASGKASLNLIKMAKPGLALDLRTAVHKVFKTGRPFRKDGIEVNTGTDMVEITIDVQLVDNGKDGKLCLIVFMEKAGVLLPQTRSLPPRQRAANKLEEELAALREDMRSLVEEQEASNEELQSANEEIVSTNEELQSINEELETSKEELESSNEELLTINLELQTTNEQLAESYDYAEAMFDTINEAVLVLDRDFRIQTANSGFYRIFRLTEEQTIGAQIFDLGNYSWNIASLKKFLLELTPVKTVQKLEVAHSFPALGDKILRFFARKVMQETHRQQLILLSIEDITEHRQAERVLAERGTWFSNMADNAPVMIWVAGQDKLRHFFNRTWLDFTGRILEEEKGNGWKEIIHADDRERSIAAYNNNFQQRLPYQVEYRLLQNDGQYRWILENGKPDYSPDGDFIGYIGCCTEIHNKRLLNDELERQVSLRTKNLKEANHELKRSNQELQQFAYVASHDLQEPLRKIMIFADRMLELKENIPPTSLKYMEKIHSATERMSHLIEDLLNFSKATKEEEALAQTDLNNIFAEVMQNFDLLMAQKQGKVHIMVPLPVVHAIPIQMKQLFYNLVANALKFTIHGKPPVVEINTKELSKEEVAGRKNLDPARRYVEIAVADNGIGFDERFAEQIFIIFQRLNNKEQYTGTGIGLALCQKIVENHGGEIYAHANENEGASFHIILPAYNT